jgi:hypothetical protein
VLRGDVLTLLRGASGDLSTPTGGIVRNLLLRGRG